MTINIFHFTFLCYCLFSCISSNEIEPVNPIVLIVPDEAPMTEDRKTPNIILLLADDLRYDALSYLGNSNVNTPNLDLLSQKGVFFHNANVTTAICCASRASIFTGQYARRHGIHNFTKGFSELEFATTYPMLLKEAGYNIGFIGKFGVGSHLPSSSFDYWKGFGGQGSYYAKDKHGDNIHLTDLMTNQMEECIDQFVADEKPFCLQVSFKSPHVQEGGTNVFPFADRFNSTYEGVFFEKPSNFDDYDAFPSSFKQDENGIENEARIRWNHRFSTDEKYQNSLKGYHRLVAGQDEAIGHLLTKLEVAGIENNTIIIYLSDNGFYLGEHGLSGKWYGHQEAIRIPMLIFDPREEELEDDYEHIVLNIDIAPTILDIADLEVPQYMQGRSLMPFLRNESPKWRTYFVYEHMLNLVYKPGAWYVNIPQTEGLIFNDYKYMRYIRDGNAKNNLVYEELFNIDKDKHEDENLVDVKPALKEQMRSDLDLYLQQIK